MTLSLPESLTFIVRMWREIDAAGQEQWHARVEHVGSQEVGYAEDVGGVARFIERWAGGWCQPPDCTGKGGRK